MKLTLIAFFMSTSAFAAQSQNSCDSEIKLAAANRLEATVGGTCTSRSLGKGVCMKHVSSVVSFPFRITYDYAVQPGSDCVVQITNIKIINQI